MSALDVKILSMSSELSDEALRNPIALARESVPAYIKATETQNQMFSWIENAVFLGVGFFAHRAGAPLNELILYMTIGVLAHFFGWLVLKNRWPTDPHKEDLMTETVRRIFETDNRLVRAAEYRCLNCRPDEPNQVVRIYDEKYEAPGTIQIGCAVCDSKTRHELTGELTPK